MNRIILTIGLCLAVLVSFVYCSRSSAATQKPRYNGVEKGVSPRTVQLLDMYPTLVELCGLPQPYEAPARLEGHSLVSLLRNPRAQWDHAAFSVVRYQGKLGKSVRTERWHYVIWDGGAAGEMLLDHANDPNELKNLAADPAYARTVNEMRKLLAQIPDARASEENK